jgi:hypothetical protein
VGQNQMDIMLDGYIAQTLTPFCTEKYLKIFMSCLDKQRGSLFVFNNQWIIACPTTTKTVYEVFDRKVNLDMGTIVPQPSTIGVSKKSGVLSPVFFIQRDGTLGIPYEFPVLGQCTLHNATALSPTILKRGNQNMRIRLQVTNLLFPLSCETCARKELAYVFGC